jgi:hypothetical protein
MKPKYTKQQRVLSVYSKDGVEADFFFEDDKIITLIDHNDGDYRDEYMNPLFEHFGVQVKRLKKLTKKQQAAFNKSCKEYGYDEEEWSWG